MFDSLIRFRLLRGPIFLILAVGLFVAPSRAQRLNLGHPVHVFPNEGLTFQNSEVAFFFDKTPGGLVRLKSLTNFGTGVSFDTTTLDALLCVSLAQPECQDPDCKDPSDPPPPQCENLDLVEIKTHPAYHAGNVTYSKWIEGGEQVLQLYWNACQPSGSVPAAWDPTNSVDITLEIALPDGDPLAQWRASAKMHITPYLKYDLKRITLRIDVRQLSFTDKVLYPSFNGQVLTNPAGNIDTSVDLKHKGHHWKKFSQLYAVMSPDHQDSGIYFATRDVLGFHAKASFLNAHPDAPGVPPGEPGFFSIQRGHHGHTFGDLPADPSEPKLHSASYPWVLGVFEGDWWDAARLHRDWLLTTPQLPEPIATSDDMPLSWRQRPITYNQNLNIDSILNDPIGLASEFKALDELFTPDAEIGGRESAAFQWTWYYDAWDEALGWSFDPDQAIDDGLSHYVIIQGVDDFFDALKERGIIPGAYTLSFGGSIHGPDADLLAAHGLYDRYCQLYEVSPVEDPNVTHSYIMDPSDDWFQTRYEAIASGLARHHDIGWLYFDNPWVVPGDYGQIGDEGFQGFFETMRRVRDVGRVHDPDFMVMFEAFHPMYTRLGLSATLGSSERPPDIWVHNAFENTQNVPLHEALVHPECLFLVANSTPFITSIHYWAPLFANLPNAPGLAEEIAYGEGILASLAGGYRWGKMVNHSERGEVWVDEFWDVFEPEGLEAYPQLQNYEKERLQDYLDNYIEFARLLIKARLSEAQKFLVEGELMRSLELGMDGATTKDFTYIQNDGYYVADITPDAYYQVRYPTVMNSVWKAADGSLGILLINYNETEKTVTWSIDATDPTYGLDSQLPLFVRELDHSIEGSVVDDIDFKLVDIDPTLTQQVTLPPRSVVFYEIRHDIPNGGAGAVTAGFEAGDLDGLEKVFGPGTYMVQQGGLELDGISRFLVPGSRYRDQEVLVELDSGMPLNTWVGVVVQADDPSHEYSEPTGTQSMIYLQRTVNGLRGKVWIGDGTETFVGDVIPTSQLDPDQGFVFRVQVENGTAKAWARSTASATSPSIPLLTVGGGPNGYAVPTTLDGGWTSVRNHAPIGTVMILDSIMVRRLGAIPDLFFDSNGGLCMSLVQDGIGPMLSQGQSVPFTFTYGGEVFDWNRFVIELIGPGVFVWESFQDDHAILRGPNWGSLAPGESTLTFDFQSDSDSYPQ